jgi:Tol biopolymer transport system component
MSQNNPDPLRRFLAGSVCAAAVLWGVTPAHAAFPGQNGRIAYVDPGGGISSVRPNGMGRQRLVRQHSGAPAYSPDGDRLVFSSSYVLRTEPNPFVSRFELSRLELVRADGRGHAVLTTGADDFAPAWAPDGRRIVFARAAPCDKYYTVEADCPRRVERDARYGILIRRRHGGTRVVDNTVSGGPVWSPDGKLISYPGLDYDSLDAIRPDTSGFRTIADGVGPGGHDWSPDGARIVFASQTGVDSYIAVMRRNGTGRRRLVRNGRDPAYSPDGRRIVFVRNSPLRGRFYRHCDDTFGQSLWLMRASGGPPQPLRYASGRRICGSAPDWQPLP